MSVGAPKQSRDEALVAFVDAWDEFFAALRRARGRAARERDERLTLPQYHLCSALADSPGLPVGELALSAGVSPPTATRMVAGLERAGIVTRAHSCEDRRVVTVTLTPAGRKLVGEKRRRIAKRRRALFDSLTPSERAQAGGLLRRLGDAVEEL